MTAVDADVVRLMEEQLAALDDFMWTSRNFASHTLRRALQSERELLLETIAQIIH